MYTRRKNGFYIRQSAGYLVLYGMDANIVILDPPAVMIYSVIDGVSTPDQIKSALKHQLGADSGFKEKEFDEGLLELFDLEVIEQTTVQNASLPFVTIAFQGFWEQFNESNNYLLLSVMENFTPVFVNPKVSAPQLIFINDSKDITGYDASRYPNISIGVLTNDSSTSNRFDFTITTFDHSAEKSNGQPIAFFVPLLVFHINWSRYGNSGIPFMHKERMKECNPDKLSGVLLDFLDNYYKEEPDTEAGNFWYDPPVNTGKITDFRRIEKGKLTIGMSTYDDYDGVYFTLQSIRLHHREICDKLEFIVLDNHPGGPVGEALEKLGKWIPNYRYIPFEEFNGTSVRDVFFREANTEYVMSIDSHVLIHPGGIRKLIEYLDDHPDTMDLIQGPLIYDDIKMINFSSSFRAKWSAGMYGVWHKDKILLENEEDPIEIPMHGLGVFACRKVAWPGFNPRMRGFGGEEGYIHEKFRQGGQKTICLPALKWLHRFGRPSGITYPNLWKDRIRNYYLAFEELGWDTYPIAWHFNELLGSEPYHNIHTEIRTELSHPFQFFDAVYLLIAHNENVEEAKSMYKPIQSTIRIFRIPEQIEKSGDYNSVHQKIVDNALKYGFDNVMILDSVPEIKPGLYGAISDTIKTMKSKEWKSFYLGYDSNIGYLPLLSDKMFVSYSDRPSNCCVQAYNLKNAYSMAIELEAEAKNVNAESR